VHHPNGRLCRRGTKVQAEFPSSYPNASASRPLPSTVITRFPATMNRSHSRPGPTLQLLIPARRWSREAKPPRRVSQVPSLICLRAPPPTTPRSPAAARAHCFTTSLRFPLRAKIDHFPFALTRPRRVHWRYGSRIRRSRLRLAELPPLTLDWLPVERAITGSAPFSLQDQPGLTWHTHACATRRIQAELADACQHGFIVTAGRVWLAVKRCCGKTKASSRSSRRQVSI
jgi:hypothetical protein